MVEITRTSKGGKMDVKKVVAKIDLYMQRHCKAKPMTPHDKTIIQGHILPLVLDKKPAKESRVDTVEQPEKK